MGLPSAGLLGDHLNQEPAGAFDSLKVFLMTLNGCQY